jgi:hypothetical protein
MATHSASTEASNFHESTETGLAVRSVAELVATTLCGLRKVNNRFVQVNAALGDDGYIDVELTRVYFDGENVTMRVLLHPTAAVPVTSRSAVTVGHGPRSVA